LLGTKIRYQEKAVNLPNDKKALMQMSPKQLTKWLTENM
jgi:hypothetical protein